MEAKKLITATDTQYSGSLLQALNDQRMQGLYCDVTVIVEERKFRAHKNILSACSTYFHQLFIVAGPVVELNFVRAEIFAEILNYIYSAKIVRVKCDMLEELIKSGKLLGVPFIAELGIPLSQVKSISGGVKDGSPDAQSSTDAKAREPTKNSVGPASSGVSSSGSASSGTSSSDPSSGVVASSDPSSGAPALTSSSSGGPASTSSSSGGQGSSGPSPSGPGSSGPSPSGPGSRGPSPSGPGSRGPSPSGPPSGTSKGVGGSEILVISESVSLSAAKALKESQMEIDSTDDDSDDDVIFCSETVPPKQFTSEKKEPVHPTASATNDQVPNTVKVVTSGQPQFVQNTKPQNQPALKNIAIVPKGTSPVAPNTNSSLPTQNLSTNGSFVPSAPQQASDATIVPVHSQTMSSGATVTIQKPVTATINQNLPRLQPIGIIQPKTELILDGTCISTPPSSSVVSLGQHTITHRNVSFDGVQKKQVVTFSPGSSSKPGEFKIKIADVVSGSSKEPHLSSEPRRIMDGKKIITLDTPSEIEGLSAGCKVYANIGEDTYDIVIPIKEDPDEELIKLDDDGFPNRKRMKLKHDDHYELIVDGRVYYICIVCKRSYVCLTSLRRHFNVHSWEKKYPCRYCERVFPLAEYRTKHEIHHTGERRYQCLTCGGSFINYQVMASHIRSVHSMDPAGDSKLYRLNPCKTLQIRQYAYISDNTNNVPVISDGGIVYDIDPDKSQPASSENHSNDGPKPVNWDDIFIQQSGQNMFKPTTPEGGTEFEFVIPESY